MKLHPIAISPFVLVSLAAASCAGPSPSSKVGAELEHHAGSLLDCRAQGRAAADAGKEAGYAAYEACKAEAGIQ